MGHAGARIGKFLLLLLLLSAKMQAVVAAEPLVINSGRGAPHTEPDHSGFYDRLVVEWFSRLGLEAKTMRLPSERALINANSGLDDGNIARIKGLERIYPNLVRVPETVITFEFLAFVRQLDFAVAGWESLEPFNIAYITGWKILERQARYYKSLTRARDGDQLFGLLDAGRVDLVLYERWSGLWRIRHKSPQVRYLEPPLESRDLFLYVNRRHAGRVEELATALRAMKKDGTYQRIFDETLGRLLN